ncbi:hypothetical protein BU26DRAFT_569428 [Trematosphaeria pertusa]|uniref:Uncharacterized protein n=1 Tax=Trematosphaeria pertusa TaxID=390896 RepID=A0A6A6I1V6_9PLEO|nr:uncharacterized protein BU26DRAFT_569428 [Trematosphaeria pertusa]KAF2244445.1 hypothetical protein BU26DRAFT_569428 [Trematosphaeria pertusa]
MNGHRLERHRPSFLVVGLTLSDQHNVFDAGIQFHNVNIHIQLKYQREPLQFSKQTFAGRFKHSLLGFFSIPRPSFESSKLQAILMCIFNYNIYSCGHTEYHYGRATTTSCTQERVCELPTFENMGEDQYHLLYEAQVRTAICAMCDAGDADLRTDPYLKNLQGIAFLLEQALEELQDSQSATASRAREVVCLLSRMSNAYWASGESRPDREEMRMYVAYATNCVEKARAAHKPEKVGVPHVLRPPASANENARCFEPFTRAFSEDSIERQLCHLVPQMSVVEAAREPLLMHRAVYAPVQAVRLPSVSAQEDFMRHMVLSRDCEPALSEDGESSIITDPFMEDLSCPASPTLSTWSKPFASEDSAPKTYFFGRDNWDCDFCGPECFCADLYD